MAGAGLLGGYSGSQRFDHSRARRGRALNPEILIQSRDIAQAAIFKLSETSSVHAAIKFFFYGVVKSHDFEKFGLVDFYRLPSPMDFDELDGLFSCVISTMNYIDRSMGYWPSYEDAKEFLTQLAMTNFEKFSMGKLKEFMSARHPLYVDSFFWQRTYQRILKDSSLKKGVKAGFVVVRHIHLEINNLPEHRSRAATVRTQVDLVRVEKKIIADSALPPEIKQRLERLVSGDISVFRGIE